MQKLEQQLVRGSEQVTLSVEDRALMREHLVQYMEYKPIRRTEKEHPVLMSPRRAMFTFLRARHVSGALAIALIVTTSTYSVSFAAADALPGDLLYTVKVHVNEELKTMLTTGDEAQIAWQRERVELRLEEASALASQGRLDAERQEVLVKQFTQNTDTVVKSVREVEARDPILAAEASAELADTLDTHKAVLARMVVEQEAAGVVEDGARGLVEEVHRVARTAEVLRDEAEDKLALAEEQDPSVMIEAQAIDVTGESSVAAGAITSSVDVATQENKERAATRAQERASALRVEASELVAARDDLDPIKAPAQQQVEAGLARIAEADSFMNEGRFGRAYAAYRSASSMFHKVVALLAVADTYMPNISAGMLAEDLDDITTPAQDEVPSEEAGVGEASPAEIVEDVVPGEDAVERSEDENVPASAEGVVQEVSVDVRAREAINTLERVLQGRSLEDPLVAQVRSQVNDAQASMLRADIARSMGDDAEATRLSTQALKHAEQALATLSLTPDTADEDESATLPPEDEPVGAPLTVTHSYLEGTHAFQGSLVRDDLSCGVISVAELSTTEAISTALSLALTALEGDASSCEETDGLSFYASTTAVPEVVLERVTLNGEDLPFTVIEDVSIHTDTATGSGKSLLQRAFEGTQSLLHAE